MEHKKRTLRTHLKSVDSQNPCWHLRQNQVTVDLIFYNGVYLHANTHQPSESCEFFPLNFKISYYISIHLITRMHKDICIDQQSLLFRSTSLDKHCIARQAFSGLWERLPAKIDRLSEITKPVTCAIETHSKGDYLYRWLTCVCRNLVKWSFLEGI